MESNMLENSLIYLLDAVNRLNEPTPDHSAIKYAIVHLWRGLNLLLKKRLFDEHWSLIYKNMDYTKDTVSSGGFIPIAFIDIKDRLSTICGIDIVEYNEVINKIRKDYKKIELSRFSGSKTQAVSNLVHLWPFIVEFSSRHIDFSHDTYATNLFNQTCETMDVHLKFVHHRKMEVNNALSNELKKSYYARPLKCPACLQPAIALLSTDNTKIRCAFCDHVLHWKELAAECESSLDYSGPFDCLHCNLAGVIQTPDRWICLSCCQNWKLEDIRICQSCKKKLVWTLSATPHCQHCSTK